VKPLTSAEAFQVPPLRLNGLLNRVSHAVTIEESERTLILGSNQDPGPDDRYRCGDDQQVDGKPLRNRGHSLVPLLPRLCAGRGRPNVNQFTRDKI
jgi:hypothetical protein